MEVRVKVHTNSKRPKVEENISGSLDVYVNQPPVEGKANKAVISALAEYFKTSKSKVVLVRGEKSKQKTFKVVQ